MQQRSDRIISIIPLVTVISLHLGVLFWFGHYRPTVPRLPMAEPVIVSLIPVQPTSTSEPPKLQSTPPLTTNPVPPETPPPAMSKNPVTSNAPPVKPPRKPIRKREPLRQMAKATEAPIPVRNAPTEAFTAPPVAAPRSTPPDVPEAPITPPLFNVAYLNNPAPEYPPMARSRGEQGHVALNVLVNAEGLPEQIDIKTSSGSPRLDRAALEAVRHWRFVPAKRGTEPIRTRVIVPIKFVLKERVNG
jgi:TonB family C-terminal domain